MSTYVYGLHPGSPTSTQQALITSLVKAGFQDIESSAAEIRATTSGGTGLWTGNTHHTIAIGDDALTWTTDRDDTESITRALDGLPAAIIDDAGLRTAIDQAGRLDKRQVEVVPYLATVLTPHDRVCLVIPCHEFELASPHAVAVITTHTVTVGAMGSKGFTSRVVPRSSIQSVGWTDTDTQNTVRISTSVLTVCLGDVPAERGHAVIAELSSSCGDTR